MSGGAHEYVMGTYNKTIGSSGFSTFPEEKYYNLYTSTSSERACNNGVCYGHALSETLNWYQDKFIFLDSSNSLYWILRGMQNTYSNVSGIFGLDSSSGLAYVSQSARFTLTPGA